jgi:hypothetical protein
MLQINDLSNRRSRIWLKVAASLLIGTWAAYASAAETATSDGALRGFLQDYLKSHGLTEDRTTRYSVASVSLDDKTQMELVYISGQRWCGSGGCTALLLKPEQSSFKIIERFTLVRLPIRVLTEVTNGWHEIAMWVQGGGISGRTVVLRYDGAKYPSNPSTAPTLQSTGLPDSGLDLPLKREGEVLYP